MLKQKLVGQTDLSVNESFFINVGEFGDEEGEKEHESKRELR